jgi:histidine ammonia-lyase
LKIVLKQFFFRLVMFIRILRPLPFIVALTIATSIPASARLAEMYFKAKPSAEQVEARERNRVFFEALQRWRQQQQSKNQDPH